MIATILIFLVFTGNHLEFLTANPANYKYNTLFKGFRDPNDKYFYNPEDSRHHKHLTEDGKQERVVSAA